MIKWIFKFILSLIVCCVLLFFMLFSMFDNYSVALEFTNRLVFNPSIAFIMLVISVFIATSENV